MKEVDYFVVGLGIAGITFCERLVQNQKRFLAIDSGANFSTAVSGGVYNPVVLKRFTKAWMAEEHLKVAVSFYYELAEKLNISLLKDTPVLRIFNSIEEQNDWFVASDKNELAAFLSSEITQNTNPEIIAPYGFGKVNGTGKIYPLELLRSYRSYLQKNDRLLSESFVFEKLQQENGSFRYRDYSAKKIVFAEGASALHNPFFPKQLLIPNKGEYLLINAPQLQLNEIVKGPLFIIPQGNDVYKVGATYSRDDETLNATPEAREQIISKLHKMISCDFEIVDQIAGIRPTTKDRKPLLGRSEDNTGLVFFNGLGTRGIMMAPLLSEMLFNYLEKQTPLPEEVDMKRFL